MIKLTITEKGGEPRALSFDQNEVSIGRVQGNDIVLPKGNISKRHSKLTLSDGRMVVADVKSTNGTYVNGRKIGEATPVRPGDKIFVGDFLIVIDPHGAPTAEVSTSGSRRTPPPPPPPPPRPGSGMRPAPSLPPEYSEGEAADDGGYSGQRDPYDDGELGGLAGPSGLASVPGRGRPPAPPPPPPRRTIVTPALQDDSVDIGLGGEDAPPSPDEVGADGFGDMPAQSSNGENAHQDSGDGGFAAVAPDAGNDVFGSHAADDEDSVGAGGFPGMPGEISPSGQPSSDLHRADDNDRLAGVPTPAPVSASRISALVGGTGDTHAPATSGLEALLSDPAVTSILIAAGGAIQVERAGKTEIISAAGDGNAVAETVWQLANTAVPPPPADNPVVDVRLLDGTRLTALFPPITVGSVSAVIRKVSTSNTSLAEIAGSSEVESLLRAAINSRRNLILVGDLPAVGTVYATLADAVPTDRRVVSIGGAVKARSGWIELGLGTDPASLARAAVAFRAEHLLFSEAGGAELPELLLAAARGQEGVVACMAARSAIEGLARLRSFTVGVLGAAGFAGLVASTVDLIVVAGSLPGGGVRILEIGEPQVEGETLNLAAVARRSDKTRGTSPLEVAGVSARLAAAIATATDELPGHLIRR